MHQRKRWLTFGLIAGALCGVVVVLGGTHGWAGESDEHRTAHQSFFWITLYDLSGPTAEVKAIEQRWAMRLYPAGAIIGALVGLTLASRLTRPRT